MNNHSATRAAAPLRIAMHGFSDEHEARKVEALFSRAHRWQQPWQVVREVRDAELLLVAADAPHELERWHGYEDRLTDEHLIAYSAQPFKEARWHLRRLSDRQAPSPLEFTLLLKEIAQRLASAGPAKNVRQPAAKTAKKYFDWRERLKILIVGSVGSGKTTAVHTLGGGNAISTEAAPSDQTQLRKKSTTVAMDFGCFGLGEDTQLHIYGAPGQRRFDFMGEILIRKSLGIIILVSNAAGNPLNELNYYLDANRDFLRHNRAVVGVTHNDLNPHPSLNEYARFMQTRGESWPVFKVDARKREDMMKLVDTLVRSTLEHG